MPSQVCLQTVKSFSYAFGFAAPPHFRPGTAIIDGLPDLRRHFRPGTAIIDGLPGTTLCSADTAASNRKCSKHAKKQQILAMLGSRRIVDGIKSAGLIGRNLLRRWVGRGGLFVIYKPANDLVGFVAAGDSWYKSSQKHV